MSASTQTLLPKDIVKEDDPSTWDIAWSMGITPWDHGGAQPSLVEAIESTGLDFQKGGRVLVPGCGTGYDLAYLSSALQAEALGLEISETARKAATKFIDEAKLKDASIKTTVEVKDFFEYNPGEEGKFDLIYDHTFFCAIPPSKRINWGEQMAQLVKPNGYLVVIVFPMLPYVETGPPYYLRPDHYDGLLEGNFNKVLDKIPNASSPSHEGKERLVIWKRN